MSRILLVDDDEDFVEAAATVLRGAGYEVETALDPAEATRRLQERTPDLLVLDVMFPEDPSAGFKLAREIRQSEGDLRKVPILMLTAVNTRFPLGFGPGDIDDAWLPITDFLEKPVDMGVLQKRVAALLGGGGAERTPGPTAQT